ncbi:GNAT family N-acetyltransferase [Sediminitomix flava]|uniref:Ribosomal-protein-alanine N-acetyltransferase n=1 Tax=Sediminitomix flava TaxID=379075 RepID=A0A315Z6V7_SEDFL|nr:GNAT family N-acetyltransferase [Sediminitomix flava]PWJ39374.1 ribosomal-protein-alanine N-acetyltransferase [Sediminitomix flava]
MEVTLENIETERTILRELNVNDIEDLYETYSNVEAMKYRYNPPLLSMGEALVMVKEAHRNARMQKSIRWGIEEKESGRLIGTVVWFLKGSYRRDEIGYSINRDWWGKGLMTEILTEVLHHLQSVGVETLRARVHRENLSSQKVLEKNGFTKEVHSKTDTIIHFHINFSN